MIVHNKMVCTQGARYWFNKRDNPGAVMSTLLWALTLYSDVVVLYVALIGGWGVYNAPIYFVLSFMALVSQLKTMFTNPGAVPRHAQPLIRASESGIPETICGRCDAYKPPRSHHCRICNRCIVRMDHHCPWMNNCVGANNQKHFMLFLFYTIAQCVYVMALVIVNFQRNVTYATSAASGMVIALFAITIATLMFVSTMMYNQVYAIVTGVGTIDRMRKRGPKGNFAPVPWVDVFGVDPWPMYVHSYLPAHALLGTSCPPTSSTATSTESWATRSPPGRSRPTPYPHPHRKKNQTPKRTPPPSFKSSHTFLEGGKDATKSDSFLVDFTALYFLSLPRRSLLTGPN